MSASDVPPFARLSDAERQRLRPSVDAAALERFIAAAGPEVRLFALLTFVTEISREEFRGVATALGHLDLLEDSEAETPPAGVYHPPGAPERLGYYVRPTLTYDLQISRPDDPALATLFDAIEPGPSGAV